MGRVKHKHTTAGACASRFSTNPWRYKLPYTVILNERETCGALPGVVSLPSVACGCTGPQRGSAAPAAPGNELGGKGDI